MITIEEIIKICKEFGLENPKIKLTNSYKMIGTCREDGIIELSRLALRYNDGDAIKAIIGHEIAHLKEFNHKKEFKDLVKSLGTDESKIIPITRYIIFCPRCKKVVRANRLKFKIFFCPDCNKKGFKQELMLYKHEKPKVKK